MCHFAMGLTQCYKTTVFFYIYLTNYVMRVVVGGRASHATHTGTFGQ